MPIEETKTSSEAAFFTIGRLEALLIQAVGELEISAEGYKATAQKRRVLEILRKGQTAITEFDNHVKPKEGK